MLRFTLAPRISRKTQRGGQNAILVYIAHILQLKHPPEPLSLAKDVSRRVCGSLTGCVGWFGRLWAHSTPHRPPEGLSGALSLGLVVSGCLWAHSTPHNASDGGRGGCVPRKPQRERNAQDRATGGAVQNTARRPKCNFGIHRAYPANATPLPERLIDPGLPKAEVCFLRVWKLAGNRGTLFASRNSRHTPCF